MTGGGYKQGQLFKAVPNWLIGEVEAPTFNDPMTAYRYLEGRRQTITDTVRQRPLLRLWDKNMNYVGQIAQEKSVQVEELMSDSGTATCVLRRDNWLSDFILHDRRAEEDLHFTLDPVPTKPDWRTRWGGKVVNTNAKRSSDGLHTVELECVSNREHVKHLLGACNPVFAPEVQLPKMWIFPANTRTALSISMWINLARQFFPALAIPTNIFNPGAWVGTGLEGFDPLAWPVQVQFCNPIFDQSRFTIFTSRWSDFHTTSAPLLDDAGCMIRAYTWLREDETSPHPELELKIPGLEIAEEALHEFFPQVPVNGTLADLARPHRNCVVLAVEDKSGVTGPTGTMADGMINLIAATADDLFTETLLPFDKDHDGSTDPLIRKWFGVAPAKPWVVFRDGDYSGIVESQQSIHASTAKTITIGGKSPGWVNQLQTFAIKYGLAQLSEVIQLALPEPGAGAAAGSGEATGWANPGTPGLEELYQGQLDDTLLAWQRFTHPARALQHGDFGYLEHFEQGGTGSAYTVSGELSIRAGLYKTRSYTSFKTTVRNGAPYLVDVDFTLGDRLGFQMGNTIHTDQCTGIRRSYDSNKPIEVSLLIGDDKEEEDPVARAMRTLAVIWNTIGMLLGSGDAF